MMDEFYEGPSETLQEQHISSAISMDVIIIGFITLGSLIFGIFIFGIR